MIDIHSHILPGIDDGSASVEESLELLRLSRQQGVELLFATPHFSAVKENPERFLIQRQIAAEKLSLSPDTMPQVRLGAEVAYFGGMSRCQELEALCLEGTNLLLLEMPFAPWTDRMISEVCSIRQQLGLTPVLAHVERYARGSQMGKYRSVLLAETLFQCNADYFLHFTTRGKALRQLQSGQIHLLGSDAHNLSHRTPKLGDATRVIREKLGDRFLSQLNTSIRSYLEK